MTYGNASVDYALMGKALPNYSGVSSKFAYPTCENSLLLLYNLINLFGLGSFMGTDNGSMEEMWTHLWEITQPLF